MRTALACFLNMAIAASGLAGSLVLRGGKTLLISGYKVVGSQVAVTLPTGAVVAFSLSDVDATATERANASVPTVERRSAPTIPPFDPQPPSPASLPSNVMAPNGIRLVKNFQDILDSATARQVGSANTRTASPGEIAALLEGADERVKNAAKEFEARVASIAREAYEVGMLATRAQGACTGQTVSSGGSTTIILDQDNQVNGYAVGSSQSMTNNASTPLCRQLDAELGARMARLKAAVQDARHQAALAGLPFSIILPIREKYDVVDIFNRF
ncbi:MAG: hypothetical protein ACHQQS_17145 [Thermoanaerobaculales bacterium]